MRPISIRFRCFGPYMAEQRIVFEELGNLFLISGETGAGKTTILDAMCYALYGRSSGDLRGGMENMRCKAAGKSDVTYVEFEFAVNGRQYKFTRQLSYGRKNLNDEHNCMVLLDGSYVPLLENPKATYVNKKAEELLGLSYEQFCQVIILPQGKFEKLLVSDSDEKEAVLVSLFRADRWQRVTEELNHRIKAADAALREEKLKITTELRTFGCSAVSELEELLLTQSEQERAMGARLAQAVRAAEQAEAAYQQALLEERDFAGLAEAEAALAALQQQSSFFAQEQARLNLADEAEKLRPGYTAFLDAREKASQAQAAVSDAEKALDRRKDAEQTAQRNREAHMEQSGAYRADREAVVRLAAARELYASMDALEQKCRISQRNCAAKQKQMLDADRGFDIADAACRRAEEKQETTMASYRSANARYMAGIYGTIASQLTAGQPCPVCGSTQHPHKAEHAQGTVSEEEVKALSEALTAAMERVNTARSNRTEKEKLRAAAQTEYQQAQQSFAADKATYENALTSMLEGIASLAALEERIAVLNGAISRYERREKQTSEELIRSQAEVKTAETELHKARASLQQAEENCAAAEEIWQQALQGSPFADAAAFASAAMDTAQSRQRRERMIRFHTELEKAAREAAARKEKTAGREAPDMAKRKAEKQQLDDARDVAGRQHAVLKENLARLEKAAKSLRAREETCALQRQKTDRDLEFVRHLSGSSGVSLQRYVLGVMLSSVTQEANRLLKDIYGGRYQLHRTDETSGRTRKGGLELAVYDRNNNELRNVKTLSGGEKFLVSLSLAIGLAAVVQAQGRGVRMEAMFIDEGFGSLDRASVNDALDVLRSVQRGDGMVGIISHVEQLENTIPARIEAHKRNGVSYLTVKGI